MTAIFQDIRATLKTPKQQEPIKGIQFAKMLYADDTLLFRTHTHTINKLLHAVQQESGKYNMKLKMGTCVNLTINRHQSSIKFLDGTPVPRKSQVIMQRLGAVNATAQLQPFWSQSRTTVKWRRHGDLRLLWALSSINGLETIQLTRSEQNTLDAFQLLRQILRVP